jgi:hypothetical protein
VSSTRSGADDGGLPDDGKSSAILLRKRLRIPRPDVPNRRLISDEDTRKVLRVQMSRSRDPSTMKVLYH